MIKNFFPNKVALITMVSACFIVFATMGLRQTFGLFSNDFEIDCGISTTEFGLAIAIHAIVWGIFTPIAGRFADKHGGNVITIFALIFYGIGVFLLGNNFNTGAWFQINLGLLVGLGLAGSAGPIIASQVTKHFPNENRTKAAGLLTACGGLGMFVFPIASKFFISETTWQNTFIIFSVFLLLT